MRKLLTSILELVARLIPLGAYEILIRRTHTNFFYHAVSDEPMAHVRHLYPVVPVAQFEDALDYLQERYQFVPYACIHANRLEGNALPSKAVHLSFDDGFGECFSVVRPLLLEHSIPCTFFLSTDWIDNQAMFYRNKISLCIERMKADPSSLSKLAALTPNAAAIQWLKELRLPDEATIDEVCDALGVDWKTFLKEKQPYLTTTQIQQMHAEGFTIGAHTKTHRKLKDLPDAEIVGEIVDSCRKIQEITGQEIVPFSFPHSAFGIDRGLLSYIRAMHSFVGLLFDTKGVRQDDNFIVNRVWAERPLENREPQFLEEAEVLSGLSPLPKVLHNAYQEAWVDEIMGFGRKLRGR